MIAMIILLLVSLSILILYIAALLVFTPYAEDDKYLLKILESGFRFHDQALKNRGIFKIINECIAKFILWLSYNILKDRTFVDNKK